MKPPYQVPTMAQVRAIPYGPYKAVSLFAGAGGSSLGYRQAGVRVHWACEFNPHAAASYRENFPDTILDTRDIREVKGLDILRATELRKGDIDILDGSPPCNSFSTSGAREKNWGEVKSYAHTSQRTDDLFYEYTRLLTELSPRTFVAENVSGLIKGTSKGIFVAVLAAMREAGYKVRARLLDAQYLGVPQKRERLIFIGVREDLSNHDMPEHPTPLPYRYSIRDALGSWLEHPSPDNPVEDDTWVEGYAVARLVKAIPMGGSHPQRTNLKRSHPDDPCFAMVAANGSSPSTAGVLHPFYRRKWSIAESKRLSSIPADFYLAGDYADQFERIGQCVPPAMMESVAHCVTTSLDHAMAR